jgi:type IV secretion system protein VirB4
MKIFRRRIANPTKAAGPIGEVYSVDRFITNHVFRTKPGHLGVAYKLQGIDAACLSDQTIESHSQRLAAAFRALDEDFRIYQYLIKHDGADLGTEGPYSSPVVQQTVEARTDFLNAKRLYSIRLFLVILIESSSPRCNPEYLLSRAASFQRSVNDLLNMDVLSKQKAFRLFRLLANLDQPTAEAETLKYDNYLDHRIGSSAVVPSLDGISVDLQHVEVLTLREPPLNTFPSILRNFLQLDANFVLATEYRRELNEKSIHAINAAQNHFKVISTLKSGAAILAIGISKLFGSTEREAKADIVPDASCLANIEELKDSVTRVNNESDYLGQFSLTLILHSADRVKLQGSVADAQKIIGNQEGSLIRETYNALNAYRAVIPGGSKYNFRQMWTHGRNYVDMALTYAPYTGDARNQHLNAGSLIKFTTDEGTLFDFNLHVDDLPDFCIMGRKGSGKSFLTAILLDHLQKYQPITYVLDIGGGYKLLADKHNGSYLKLQMKRNEFSMNPFALQRTEESLEFLASFVAMLLQSSGYETTPNDDRLIDKAVRKAERLSDLDLPGTLKDYLYNWTGEGRYAHLFDNRDDTLSLSDFQCFDFTGMSANPKVIGPVFLYLFSRISQVVYDPALIGRLKLFAADECWKFLRVRAARDYFIEAGKTFRKYNGGIGLITQSAGDLKKAGMLGMVKEMCPTLIFAANPGGNPMFYKKVGDLNDKEVEILMSLVPKQEVFVKTPYWSKKLTVNADPLAVLYYSNDPRTNQLRDKAITKYGIAEGLRQLAKGA